MAVEVEAAGPEFAAKPLSFEDLAGLLPALAAEVALPRALDTLALAIERRAPGVMAAVMVVQGDRLRQVAGPSLPDGYIRSADHHPIGEGVGSCGTAAHRRQLVLVEDIASDPLWKNYREIAQRYRLSACWSAPIVSPDGEVLATVALYHAVPRRPAEQDLQLLHQFASLAGMVLAHDRLRAERDETQQRLRELVEDVQGLLWESEREGGGPEREGGGRRFTQVSRAAERLLGQPAARWLAEPALWEGAIHPEDREATLRLDRNAPVGRDYELQYRLRGAGGQPVWVRDLVHARGDPPRRVGVMIDVTAQREAEQQREDLLRRQIPPDERQRARAQDQAQLLADAGSVLGASLEPEATMGRVAALVTRELADWCLILLRAPDGSIASAGFAHRDASRLALAGELERLLPQPGGVPLQAGAVLAGAGSQLLSEIPAQAFEAGAARPELMRLVRTLGAESAMVVPLPAQPGRPPLGAMLVVSAGERRYQAADLPLTEELGRRIARSLGQARLYLEAQAAIRQREQFLSIAAHELRTPLATLQLTAQSILLALESPPVDLEFVRARAEAAERQGLRLGRLINDLLDVSGIHAGQMRVARERMDLVVSVGAVLGRMHEELSRKRIDVAVHAPSPVIGRWDPVRLEQVITNLLSNAVKYGQGRPVRVTVRADAGGAELQVEDQGIGMSEEVRGRLFNAFERGVAAGHYGGLGLGLYITAQIVRAHGGTISARSTPDAGATFTVRLPVEGTREVR